VEMKKNLIFQIIKYLISGGSGVITLLSVTFLLKNVLKLYYLTTSTLSMTAAIFVSFLLQRVWTFNIARSVDIHFQFARYILLTLINLTANVILMYFFVDITNLRYMLSQFLSAGILAIWSFFAYKYYIFAERPEKLVNKTIFDNGS